MAAYKARRKRSAGLQAVSGIRTKAAQELRRTMPAPSMLGGPIPAYRPRSKQAPAKQRNQTGGDMAPNALARARKRGGARKLF